MWHLRTWTVGLVARLEELKSGEDGQGILEYGLILTLVSIVSTLILTTLGTKLSSMFQVVVNAI